MVLKILFLIFGFLSKVYCQNPTPTETYPLSQTLQSPDLYYLYWKATNIDITFELHVKDSKWLYENISDGTTVVVQK